MYSIIVVGCGATGSNFSTLVSQYAISEKKVGEIILIDGDVVERKNFINQKFTEKDIDKNKARVLANRYRKLVENVSYVDRFIMNKEDLISIIKSAKHTPILVGCVDNNKARTYMHYAFYDNSIEDIIYIDTGNGDGENRRGQTICGSKQNNIVVTPPVGDVVPQIFDEEPVVEEKKDFSCSAIQDHPQNFATNVLSATTTFLMVNNIVSLKKLKKRFLTFDSDMISIK